MLLSLISSGREFQSLGALAEETRSPWVTRADLGTANKSRFTDLRLPLGVQGVRSCDVIHSCAFLQSSRTGSDSNHSKLQLTAGGRGLFDNGRALGVLQSFAPPSCFALYLPCSVLWFSNFHPRASSSSAFFSIYSLTTCTTLRITAPPSVVRSGSPSTSSALSCLCSFSFSPLSLAPPAFLEFLSLSLFSQVLGWKDYLSISSPSIPCSLHSAPRPLSVPPSILLYLIMDIARSLQIAHSPSASLTSSLPFHSYFSFHCSHTLSLFPSVPLSVDSLSPFLSWFLFPGWHCRVSFNGSPIDICS